MEVPSPVEATPTPLASAPPEWHSDAAWKLPEWGEPVIVVCILFGACYFSRRKNYKPFSREATYTSLLDSPNESTESFKISDDGEDDFSMDYSTSSKHAPKKRSCCGATILTPNSSRFSQHWHSRIMYKFPFLMEMFYWVLTYAVYRFSHIFSQEMFSDDIWDLAQENGLRVLAFEQFSIFRFFFPVHEIEVQKWFMNGHEGLLTVLNKAYALIHIPGSVAFVAWYYYAAPNHRTFAVVRRTVSLANMIAFVIFALYPCMPPRLLPKEYGFIDTVRRDDAESVWMSGKFVNSLAAMPSMHFGYSFLIGVTCLYHAGVFKWAGYGYENRSKKIWKLMACVIGVGYPLMILTTIIATANHYWLDPCAAIGVCAVSLLCNKVFYVFIPLEDLLLWVLRIEKPKPNCGPGKD